MDAQMSDISQNGVLSKSPRSTVITSKKGKGRKKRSRLGNIGRKK